jgi:hypothetical protein
MTNQHHFLEYIRHYESKALQNISEMLADNVKLRDWKICVRGKQTEIAGAKANLDAAQRMYCDGLGLKVLGRFEDPNDDGVMLQCPNWRNRPSFRL